MSIWSLHFTSVYGQYTVYQIHQQNEAPRAGVWNKVYNPAHKMNLESPF